MTTYEIVELSSRIAVATQKAVEAARKQDWPTFDCHLAKISELRGSLPDARTLGTVILNETTDKPGTTNVIVAVEKYNLALTLHPEGMGVWEGPFAPVLLERNEGRVRLVVWADINEQDPTHMIDLSDALESNRRDTD
jgi:hypothetical protein